jgi:hypothetical protein
MILISSSFSTCSYLPKVQEGKEETMHTREQEGKEEIIYTK